jgi:hypothetical protein
VSLIRFDAQFQGARQQPLACWRDEFSDRLDDRVEGRSLEIHPSHVSSNWPEVQSISGSILRGAARPTIGMKRSLLARWCLAVFPHENGGFSHKLTFDGRLGSDCFVPKSRLTSRMNDWRLSGSSFRSLNVRD